MRANDDRNVPLQISNVTTQARPFVPDFAIAVTRIPTLRSDSYTADRADIRLRLGFEIQVNRIASAPKRLRHTLRSDMHPRFADFAAEAGE